MLNVRNQSLLSAIRRSREPSLSGLAAGSRYGSLDDLADAPSCRASRVWASSSSGLRDDSIPFLALDRR
jgi:hypothetical protein